MGIAPYLISTAVTAVLAQRLTRKLCEHCREEYEPAEAERGPARPRWAGPHSLYRPRGCSACTRGFRGRVGVFQLLTMREEIAPAVSFTRLNLAGLQSEDPAASLCRNEAVFLGPSARGHLYESTAGLLRSEESLRRGRSEHLVRPGDFGPEGVASHACRVGT
jgi:hypothetical protein